MEANSQNQINQSEPEKRLDPTLLFGHNPHFAYVYKKTEKLVTAIYMITNFIKDNEPLKWKIRETALSLMELNLEWGIVSLSERRELIKEYQTVALEIVSLTGVAHHSGLISEMNYGVIAREFNAVVSTIDKEENRKANEQTVILDPGFFDTRESEPQKTETMTIERALPAKGQQLRTSLPQPQTSKTERKPEYLPLKDIQEKKAKSEDSKDGRQAIIIKLLSKKSGLGIKDFVESIKGVSEKTIQRELLSMVASGVLKKEGERRWSTYSLAS